MDAQAAGREHPVRFPGHALDRAKIRQGGHPVS